MTIKPSETLRKAKELLETKGWCQRWFAYFRDQDGELFSTSSLDPRAEMFCALGALTRTRDECGVAGELRAESYLQKAFEDPRMAVSRWNDADGRTKDEVLAAFDKAIALAEAEGQ